MKAAVVPVTFDTTGMEQGEAFEAFCSRGWPGFASAYEVSGDVQRFFYRSTVLPTARMSAHTLQISGLDFRRAARGLRDGRDQVLVQANLSGGARWGEAAGVPYRSGAGSVGVVDFARPVIQSTRDTRAYCLLLDRDLFEPGEVARIAGFRWRDGGEGLFTDFLRHLIGRLEGASPASVAHAERSAVAMLRACKGLHADAVEEVRPELTGLAIERARKYVASHVDSPGLTPQAIAAAVGVSRATLYRLFAAAGGVKRFVQRERLAVARAKMTDESDRRSLTAIAHACGFSDAAHFTRAFRERYGVRPSDFRPLN